MAVMTSDRKSVGFSKPRLLASLAVSEAKDRN